jgi:TRAP-type C4-dicarboxylate transport system substrate-binding protein
MPALIDSMMPAMDKGEQERAKEFWDNAYAYAMQAVPYAQERLDALNQSANEVIQQLAQLPEEEQKKLFEQLKDDLVKPIEGQTAKEFDAAFKKLQGITKALHKRFVPALPTMMQPGMAPAGPPPPPPLGQLQPQGAM